MLATYAPFIVAGLSAGLVLYLLRSKAGCGVMCITALGGLLAAAIAVVNSDWVMHRLFVHISEGQRELNTYLFRFVPLFAIAGSWLFAFASVAFSKKRKGADSING